jgi:predicted PurR-regulated permease PerM
MGKTIGSSSSTRRVERERRQRELRRASLPPSGTPLTGGGGLLPRMRPSQVAPRTVVTVLVTTLLVAGALYLTWELRQILRWLVVALFLSVALNPAVSWLSARRVPRAAAILLVFAAVILAFAALGVLVVPPLVDQVQALIEFATRQARSPGGLEQAAQDLAARYGAGGYFDLLRDQVDTLPARLTLATGPLLALTRGLVGSVTALISILLLTFFLLAGADHFVTLALDLFHPLQRPRLHRILGLSADAIHGYVNGNLVISLIAGLAAFGALTALSLPYAVALGLVIALFDLIPMVGSMLGAAIVVGVVVFLDPVKAGLLVVFFLLYQQLENNVLQPLVYGRSVKLHPLAIFLAVLAGGNLLGILGALLAIPVAEILRILAAEWLASRAEEDGGIPHTADEDVSLGTATADAMAPEARAWLAQPAERG